MSSCRTVLSGMKRLLQTQLGTHCKLVLNEIFKRLACLFYGLATYSVTHSMFMGTLGVL